VEDPPKIRGRNRISLVLGLVLIVLLGGYSLLAAVTNAHRDDYRKQVNDCMLAVQALNGVLPIVPASADGKVPVSPDATAFSALFDSLESKCFGQQYLSELDANHDRFVTVRDDALAAVSKSAPNNIAAQTAARDAQFHATNELIAFLSVFIAGFDSIKEPTLAGTAKELVGLG